MDYKTKLPEVRANWWSKAGVPGAGTNLAAQVASNQSTVDDWSWANTQRNWASQDRNNARRMADEANSFLNDWMGDLDKASGIYDDALNSVGQVDTMADQLGKEWESYNDKFGGLQGDLITAAGSDLKNRGIMSKQFMDSATANYGGATRLAQADVAQQSQQGRDAMTRSMTGMGINPNSGKALSGLRQSYIDQAKNTALAMNTARNNESTRVGNMAATGMQLFDPSNTAGLALNIQGGSNDLLMSQAGLTSQGAGARESIANSYSKNVAAPRGELAGSLAGLVTSAGANPFKRR